MGKFVLAKALLVSFTLAGLSAQFPQGWTGDWEGQLFVQQGNDTLQQTTIRLGIHPLDSGRYTWAISYGKQQQDNRPYTLIPRDKARGLWDIDEHNGIVLGAVLHGEVLYSHFTVMGNRLTTRDELIGDTLYHEIIAGPSAATLATGDTVLVSPAGIPDTIPPVKSFRVSSRQWAKLTRLEE